MSVAELPIIIEAPTEPHLHLVEMPPQPQVIDIAGTPEDMWSRAKAQRVIDWAARAALQDQVEVKPVEEQEQPEPGPNLLTNVKRAADDDGQAFLSVVANMQKEASEITYKAGKITEVFQEVDEASGISQHGQDNVSIHFNSLRYVATAAPELKEATQAEARNGARLEDAVRRGQLIDDYFMVISRTEDLDDEKLEELGFFGKTKSLTIQLTSQDSETGLLKLETAFIAGVSDDQADRHDIAAVEVFGRKINIDLTGLSRSELIDRPQLVPKELFPEGAADATALMDESIGEVIGKPVFFGQDKPSQDYLTYREECFEKEKELRPKAVAATKQLISEVGNFKTPVEVSLRLHELAEAEMVQQSVHDTSIDARVFGAVAANYIEQARVCVERGDMVGALQSTYRATQTAVSSSCPTGLRESNKKKPGEADSPEKPEEETDELDCPEVKDGDTVNCPFCKKTVQAIVPDPDGPIFCSNSKCEAAHSSVKKNSDKNDA